MFHYHPLQSNFRASLPVRICLPHLVRLYPRKHILTTHVRKCMKASVQILIRWCMTQKSLRMGVKQSRIVDEDISEVCGGKLGLLPQKSTWSLMKNLQPPFNLVGVRNGNQCSAYSCSWRVRQDCALVEEDENFGHGQCDWWCSCWAAYWHKSKICWDSYRFSQKEEDNSDYLLSLLSTTFAEQVGGMFEMSFFTCPPN